jgi:hypothetical protein
MRKRGMNPTINSTGIPSVENQSIEQMIEMAIQEQQELYRGLIEVIELSDAIQGNDYVDQGMETRTWIWKLKSCLERANTPTLEEGSGQTIEPSGNEPERSEEAAERIKPVAGLEQRIKKLELELEKAKFKINKNGGIQS